LAKQLGLESVEELENAIDALEGIGPDGVENENLAREARVRSAYLDWCKEFGKTSDEIRFPQFYDNFLEMEDFAKDTGKEMVLNEYADYTEDEYNTMLNGDGEEKELEVEVEEEKVEEDVIIEEVEEIVEAVEVAAETVEEVAAETEEKIAAKAEQEAVAKAASEKAAANKAEKFFKEEAIKAEQEAAAKAIADKEAAIKEEEEAAAKVIADKEAAIIAEQAANIKAEEDRKKAFQAEAGKFFGCLFLSVFFVCLLKEELL
jgi:hypothetical protein